MITYRSDFEENLRDQNILIVDDDEAILKIISKILKASNPNYYIQTSKCVAETIELVKKTYWDTILLDLSIPFNENEAPDTKNGLYVMDILATELKLNTPIIAITGHNDDDLSDRLLDKGAYYFLNKPLRAKSLSAIVKNATKFQMSGFDGLTGLLNRRTFEERLKTEFERVIRKNSIVEGSHLSIIFFDGDNFKEINDKFNHLIGDQFLKKISSSFVDDSLYRFLDGNPQATNYIIRPYDIAARFGGDEFTIFLPETDHKNALVVARRIKKMLKEYDIAEIIGDSSQVDFKGISLSIGIATYPFPNKVIDHIELISCADHAMYASKEKRIGEIFGYDAEGKILKLD
ncbi:MAG: diguanylate cyclase [Spirochaetes bacterium]|jgi:diguanylate cyclase (GGDEF)-like protein|nr:diguanylate cyclase [Spirochaetota bacterium]